MRQVKILSGVSGSGKSHFAETLAKENISLGKPHLSKCDSVRVVTADDYFMVNGEYRFDPAGLSNAHGACFFNYIESLQQECELVVVDNTNTTSEEIAPYILGAQAYGYEVEILTIVANGSLDNIARFANRNTHGVSKDAILSQASRISRRKLPPWWKNTFIDPQF